MVRMFRLGMSIFAIGSIGACEYGWVEANCVLPKKMVLAHKGGIHQDIAPNSPAAVTKSLDAGFEGVEIDVMYDDVSNILIVSHDIPYVPVDGKILTFHELLYQTFSSRKYFIWIDAKNLKESNAERFVAALDVLATRFPIRDWAVVESRSLVANEILFRNGYKVISGAISDIRDQNQAQYYAHGLAVDIIEFDLSDGAFDIGNLPLFLYTSQSRNQIERLLLHPGVCAVLSDLPEP